MKSVMDTTSHISSDLNHDAKRRRIMLIINPVSGTRAKESIPSVIWSVAKELDAELEIRTTKTTDDASNFAREAAALGYNMVVTAGGDGTVSDVASALLGSNTELAIIPCGSGNGLARALGVPPDFTSAARLLIEGSTLTIDNGLINDRPFFCTCGVGFDAEVSRRFALEKRRGRTSYFKNILLDYLSYSPQSYVISIGGKVVTETAFLIAICNASQYGNNAYIAPKASLTDGLLDVTIVHQGSLIESALAGVDLFTGQLDRNTLIDSFRVSSATITRHSKGAAHIDGEPVELGCTMEIGVQAASLRVRVPAMVPDFKPVISPLRSMISDVASDIRFALLRK